MIKAIVIIPCKMDSTRLLNKNLAIIDGKTLLEHTIEYAQESAYVTQIVVSTESQAVKDICSKYPVMIHDRPKHLLEDTDTVDVYVNVLQSYIIDTNFTEFYESSHVIGLQPDNPDRTVNLDTMIDYFVLQKYDDLVTLDHNGIRNGSVRIIKSEYVRADNVSRRIGTYVDRCTNIHTKEDLEHARKWLNFNKTHRR